MITPKLWPYVGGAVAMALLLGVIVFAGLRDYWPSWRSPPKPIEMIITPFELGAAWPDDDLCAVLPDLFRCFLEPQP